MAEETKPPNPPRLDSNSNEHPVFGNLVEKLPQYRLPTFLQLLNYARFLKGQIPIPRGGSLRPIYSQIASDLAPLWKEAFVVPVINDFSLVTKLQTEIEKKLKSVQRDLKTIVNNSQKLETQLSNLKKLFSITKCCCFLKSTHRQDVIRSNCNCDHPIVNLETYGDQMFGYDEICLFEDEKTIFAQKVAEMEAKTLSVPTPPSSAESADAGYGRKTLATKRARPDSFGPLIDSEGEDVDMEAPNKDEVNYDSVLETMLSQGLKPFAIMKCISKFLMIIAMALSQDFDLNWQKFKKLFFINKKKFFYHL